jgi:hypothetical protein
MTFPNPPICAVNATTTNQLIGWNNFAAQSWTPTLVSAGGGTPSYTTQTGRFVTINGICMISGEIQLSSTGSLVGGQPLSITLPVTVSSSTAAAFTVGGVTNMNTLVNWQSITMSAAAGASSAKLEYKASNNDSGGIDLIVYYITNTFRIRFSGCYFV